MNPYKTNFSFSELNLLGDFTYQINEQHRDKNPNKSQWIVSPKEEVEIFVDSYRNSWFDNDHISFGIKLNNSNLIVLGKTKNNLDSKVAKFSMNSKLWHGYPADLSMLKDIPSTIVLCEWCNLGYISKRQFNRIVQGRGI